MGWIWTFRVLLASALVGTTAAALATDTRAPPPPSISVIHIGDIVYYRFRNSSLTVVNRFEGKASFFCSAPYPIQWSLNSLEHPWVYSTWSSREVDDFLNKSTYTYTMGIRLLNAESWDRTTYGGERCSSFGKDEPLSGLTTVERVVQRTTRDNNDNDEVLIPCYTVNAEFVGVDLYRKWNETCKTLIGRSRVQVQGTASTSNQPESELEPPAGAVLRFGTYEGFFLNRSYLTDQSEHEAVFVCQLTRNPQHLNLDIPGLESRDVHVKFKETESDCDSRIGGSDEGTDLDLDSDPGPQLRITRTNSGTMSCCIAMATEHVGLNNESTSDSSDKYELNNLGFHRSVCTAPLLCLTREYRTRQVWSYRERDRKPPSRPMHLDAQHETGQKCLHMNLSPPYWPHPELYICHYNYSFKSIQYQLEPPVGESAVRPVYLNKYPYNPKEILTPTSSIYEGESLRFRCDPDAVGFYYARGTVWEMRWRNGSVRFQIPFHSGFEDHWLTLKLSSGLEQILCHIPLWNSSDWVTRSIGTLPPLLPAAPPSINGSNSTNSSYVEQVVEFYVGESKELVCDFVGHPSPWLEWGGMYRLSPYMLQPTTKDQVRRLFINGAVYVDNSTIPIPTRNVSCTATSRVGSALKVFRIQAKRPVPPQILYGRDAGRELSPVFFLGDTHRVLNCTFTSGADPRPTFQWQRNGRNVSELDGLQIQEAQNSRSSLLIFGHDESDSHGDSQGVRYEDEDNYTCIVTNLGGSAFVELRLCVEHPPLKHFGIWTTFVLLVATVTLVGMVAAAYSFLRRRK